MRINLENPDQCVQVLIAEDDYFVAQEIKRVLRNNDRYKIIGEAGDGEQAIKMVTELMPDIILMDIKMPKVDGLKATRLIQEKRPTPVVILTAHDSEDLLDKASQAGVGAYLTKPPQAADMNRAMIMAIARHRDLMQVRRLNAELKESREELQDTLKKINGIVSVRTNLLEKRTRELEEMNAALQLLIKQVGRSSTEAEEKLVLNIRNLVDPYLKKLEVRLNNSDSQVFLQLIKTNLDQILSSTSKAITDPHYNLTPREIEIADLIRHGKTNKDMGRFLNISLDTIKFHRANIRKKLGLTKRQKNLRSFLLSRPQQK